VYRNCQSFFLCESLLPIFKLATVKLNRTSGNLLRMAISQNIPNGINGAVKQVKYHIPAEMKAIRYNKIKDFSLVTMPVPQPKAHEVLIKGSIQSVPSLLLQPGFLLVPLLLRTHRILLKVRCSAISGAKTSLQ
jgi:hypothetical protein